MKDIRIMSGLIILVKLYLQLNILSFGLHSVSGVLKLSANSKYVESFKPLTLTCSSDEVPVGELITFEVDNILTVRIKYITSGSKCYIEHFKNATSVGGGECNTECDCQLEGKSYNWYYNGTVANDRIRFECQANIGAFLRVDSIFVIKAVPLQEISLTPNTITKTESEVQVFWCSARSLPLASLRWSFNGSMIPISSPPNNTTDTVNSSYTYTAKKEDNGKKLSCTAVYGSISITEEVLINVLYRPSVTISPNYQQYNVIENSTNIQFDCTVTDANPAEVSYRWYKDGYTQEGFVGAVYPISQVRRSHKGSYSCEALNNIGSSGRSSAVQLNVLYVVDINPISKQEPTEFSQLNVSCNVESYPAVSHNDVTWTRPNNNIFRRKGLQLVIDNVQRIDSGTYICSVVIELVPTTEDPVNITGTTAVEVDVLYRPAVTITPNNTIYSVIENYKNLQLSCTVTDSNPDVTMYKWYKDNDVISESQTYLILTVNRSDTGSYTCDASNSVGTSNISAVVQLNILYGVELYSIKKQTPVEGDQLNISCSGKSYPIISNKDVRWSKRNNNTFSRIGMHTMINYVNRLDSGFYVCHVVVQLTPTVGQPINVTGTTTGNIDVLYRPSVTVYPDKNPYNVMENTTNVHLFCNVTATNPNVTAYKWFKDGVRVSTAAVYTLSPVKRSNTGNYSCEGSNTVGTSDSSPYLKLDVLYGVSLTLSKTEITINESEKWDLACTADGNPLPIIVCIYKHNSTVIGEQKANVTFIRVDHANCVDTGLYMCSGNNTIGDPLSKPVNITVSCKPRTYKNVEKEYVFISGTDESLNISTTFISFPLSDISWSRENPDGNLSHLDSEFIHSTMPSHLPYETISILQKGQLKEDEFGIYLVKASNIHGSFLVKYHVIAKRAPDPPTNITASCDVTSIKVAWISRFNGGETQTFRISFVNKISNQTIYKGDISDIKRNEIVYTEKESFSPNTLYFIYVRAENLQGTTDSKEIANCTTKTDQEFDQPVSSALVGGITGSISAILIVVFIVGGAYVWRRRNVPGGDKEPIKRGSKETDEDEDGLKENPLYVSSGEASKAEAGPVYGVVNKQKQKNANLTCDEMNDQGAVYSQVQKSNKQGKKKNQEKNSKLKSKNDKYKDIELGTVYENSEKLLKQSSPDELYANGKQRNSAKLAKNYGPKKNKDGLVYADLDLIPGPSGGKFVIRGIENKTNYAVIDLSIKVNPLPSDDEDEDKDNENVKPIDSEGKE